MNTRNTVILVVFGLFWSSLTLLFDGFIFGSAARQLRASRYATTEGTIVTSEVTRSTDSDGGPTSGVAVSYKYFVGDHEFTSERYRFGAASTSDSGWARALVAKWSLIFTAGIAGGGWQAGKVLSGKYDLILDELNHTLELPLTRGRKERRSVPWSAIWNIHVETVLKPTNRGGQTSPAYVPTLTFEQGGSQSEGLVEWYDEVRARELATWLREKLQGEPSPSNRT